MQKPVEWRPVCAVILAGGKAQRFQGEDKGLIKLAQRPLAAWVADRLQGQVGEIRVNANRNFDHYAALGHPVIPDTLPDHLGPLAGVLAAARATQQEWLLSVPCDVPFLPLNLVMRLYDEAHTRQVDLVRAADASGTHFAIMLLHRNLLADLDEYVQLGGRKVQTWQAKHPSATVFFDEHPQVFMNINTPDDLKNAERMAHHYLGQNHIL